MKIVNPSKIFFIGLASLLAAIPGMSAQTIVDDFNRAATAAQTSSSNPNLIGTQYTIISGSWLIGGPGPTGNYLQASTSGNNVMYENTLGTLNTDGSSFSLSADVLIPGNTGFTRTGGLIFNLQDASNYYALRSGVGVSSGTGNSRLQFIKVVGGVSSSLAVIDTLSLTVSTFYTMTISSSPSEANTFSYSLSAVGSETPIYSNSVTDATFTGGYSGFYREGSGTVRFDNYSLTVVPEPTAFALFGLSLCLLAFLRRPKLSC